MNQYQVSFGAAIQRAFSNYCVFTGRASRSEFWWFFLFTYIVNIVLGWPSMMGAVQVLSSADSNAMAYSALQTGGIMSYIYWLWGLFILLPSWGLLFRRLHDAGHSGWNWLWIFLPLVGWIILIVFLCQPSVPVENQYGPVPNLR